MFKIKGKYTEAVVTNDNTDPKMNEIKFPIIFDEYDKLLNDGYYNQRILQELLAYLDETEGAPFTQKNVNTDITQEKTRNSTS